MTTDPPIEYLGLEDVLGLVRALGAGPVRDLGLLDSAVQRPNSTFTGVDLYQGLTTKAAALLDSLVNNHALVDGNKRIGLLATAVFLHLNGFVLAVDDEEAFSLVMDVAAGHVDLESVATRLAVRPTSEVR